MRWARKWGYGTVPLIATALLHWSARLHVAVRLQMSTAWSWGFQGMAHGVLAHPHVRAGHYPVTFSPPLVSKAPYIEHFLNRIADRDTLDLALQERGSGTGAARSARIRKGLTPAARCDVRSLCPQRAVRTAAGLQDAWRATAGGTCISSAVRWGA